MQHEFSPIIYSLVQQVVHNSDSELSRRQLRNCFIFPKRNLRRMFLHVCTLYYRELLMHGPETNVNVFSPNSRRLVSQTTKLDLPPDSIEKTNSICFTCLYTFFHSLYDHLEIIICSKLIS